jgi:hypothetical protein
MCGKCIQKALQATMGVPRVARRAWYIFFTLKCALTGVRALSLKVGEKLEQVGTEAGLPSIPFPWQLLSQLFVAGPSAKVETRERKTC